MPVLGRIMAQRYRSIAVVLVLASTTSTAFGSLKDLRRDLLPKTESVERAYAEAIAVERYASAWANTWEYDTPKVKVASTLKDSLDRLQQAAASAPDNTELLLLTGLVAHYAYNVDVKGADEVALRSLQRAHQLSSDDYCPQWFLGNLRCQGDSVKDGMSEFLAVENRLAWDRLPPDFWDDYLYCASMANMPAHVLRAGAHLRKLNAPRSESREFLLQTAQKRFKPTDLNANYTGKEVWESISSDSRPVFTSTLCGFSFSPMAEWRLRRLEVQKGLCVAQMATGPHNGKAGNVAPSVTVIARQAQPGETLADFMKLFMSYPSPHAVQVSHCPAQECLAYEAVVPNAYGDKGNGHPVVTVFKRDPPEFPGLLLEEPTAPESSQKASVSVFHPHEHLRRMDGTLYYLVMLDTADSVLDDAKKDYDTLITSLHAE
jgi:hypothetical protein